MPCYANSVSSLPGLEALQTEELLWQRGVDTNQYSVQFAVGIEIVRRDRRPGCGQVLRASHNDLAVRGAVCSAEGDVRVWYRGEIHMSD